MGAASAARIDEEPTVATLRERQEVEGVYACTRKERRVSRAGTPYLTVELADSTGTIPARAFRDADVLAGRFERGELVRVRGRVERFRAELQIALEAIASAPAAHAHAERFLPVAYRDLDELEGFLEHLARELYDPGFAGLLARRMGDVRAPPASPPERAAGEGPTERPGLHRPHRAGRSARMIGEVVVDLGLADAETVDRAVELARAQGRPTGQVLVEQGVLHHDQL